MLKTTRSGDGGGNFGAGSQSGRVITVRRTAAIGDALASTVVADKLIERGFEVHFQTHHMIHGVIRRHPKIASVGEPSYATDIDLDGAYERHPGRRHLHFHDIFIQKANEQLSRTGINLGAALNCAPVLRVSPAERLLALAKFREHPRPWVFICPRSDTYACRQVPDGVWREAAKRIQGTKFWLGRHPAPEGIVDLKCQDLESVVVWLSAADLLVSVDTGPLHLGAALGVPIVALGQSSSPELHLSDQRDFVTINPKLDCLNCQQNLCPINPDIPPCQGFDPQFIADWANAKLRQVTSELVSAVIPIYKPEAATLNRCLECLLPQVGEIIVTAQSDSIIPDGALRHEKIRYVRKGLPGLGYARNTNHGVRNSTGKWLVLVNDDVFLNPDAVQRLKDACGPGVGCVAGLLRYADGTIYHAGKFRKPGQRGWGHVDLRAQTGSIKQPVEVENVNGAAVLMPRRAFYDIGAFDEEYFGYASDDDTCMKLRQRGWKIIYTPHSEGIHLEGQSFVKLAGWRGDLIRAGNETFDRKWGRWYDHNLHRVPGTFDY